MADLVKMEPIPDYGEHMSMGTFLACVAGGGFIDYDGYGALATETEMSNEYISPSEVGEKEIDPKFTHVVWFNK